MFLLLNTAIIGIVCVIVSPCKLIVIDDRLRNFTQTTLRPSSWHVLKPETAKRNDRYDYNKTTSTIETSEL